MKLHIGPYKKADLHAGQKFTSNTYGKCQIVRFGKAGMAIVIDGKGNPTPVAKSHVVDCLNKDYENPRASL